MLERYPRAYRPAMSQSFTLIITGLSPTPTEAGSVRGSQPEEIDAGQRRDCDADPPPVYMPDQYYDRGRLRETWLLEWKCLDRGMS